MPLTKLQTMITKQFFNEYEYFVFSADDVFYKESGFIEKSLELIKEKHFISFATDQDPLAYMYDKIFFNEVGFDIRLKGKDGTDNSLKQRISAKYGTLFYIGEYWKPVHYEGSWGCWGSKYVTHINGADDVNLLLEAKGIDSGSKRSKKPNSEILKEIN